MKKYGRTRRKHRQNKRAKEAADLRRLIKKIILTVKSQALVNLIRIRAQRKLEELRGMEFKPGGIIAKGPTEWGGEYVITDMAKNPASLSDLSVADALKRQEAGKHQVKMKLTGEQYKMIFNPAQNLPPEE